MQLSKTLLVFYLLTWISLPMLASVASADDDTPSAYEMLEKFNFPKGILPEGVKGYVLHENNKFEVSFNGNCQFEIEQGGYTLYYKQKITGKVGVGSLKELQGVSVKVLFMWFSINEVTNTGDGKLNFSVGPLSASFPLSNFDESPECGSRPKSVIKMVSDA